MKSFWDSLPRPFVALAPMEGVTDRVFRAVVNHTAPPDVYYSEFVNAASFCSPRGRHSTRGRLELNENEKGEAARVPVIAQIWGTNPEHYAAMSVELAKMGYAGIDINMGCPVKDVVKTGACSALIENPPLAAELIAAAKTGGLPVSVKTRIGFKTRKTEDWIGFLLRQDIAALTVHARTQKEMSKVPAHWDEIGVSVGLRDELAPDTVIIGNGDIRDWQHGRTIIQQQGCDGVMIGRGVFANPYCFEREAREHSRTDLLNLLHAHLDYFDAAAATERRSFDPLKRFFKIYIRGFDGASELRDRLMHSRSTTEVRDIIATV